MGVKAYVLCILVMCILGISLLLNRKERVSDEYSRGFLNCLSIMQHRYNLKSADSMPYWKEVERSYPNKQDLYNLWDSSYMKNR